MSSILIPVVFLVCIYTVFVPVLTLDAKHLKIGLLLLCVIGVFAYVLHLAGQL